MAAATLDRDKVMSSDGEHVGEISDIMLDVPGGRIAHAVLSEGGFLGIRSKLHAISWSALTLARAEKCFNVDISAQRLKEDPGFDKDHRPSMADATWGKSTHNYYNWEDAATVALETAAKSLRDLRVPEVTKLDMKVNSGKVVEYRARV